MILKKFLSVLFGIFLLLSPVNSYSNVEFNGTDSKRLDAANDSNFEGMTIFSWSVWVKRNGNSVDSAFGRILHNNGVWNLAWNDSAANDLNFGLYHPSFSSIGAVITGTGTWHNFIGTYNGNTPTWKLYHDCTEIASSTGKSGATNTSTDPMRIGLDEDNSTAEFNGEIDEFYFWNGYELSATDRTLLCDSRIRRIGLQINSSTLFSYNPFDECADGATCSGDNLFQDLSGSGNNNTFDSTGSNHPTGAAGEVNTY